MNVRSKVCGACWEGHRVLAVSNCLAVRPSHEVSGWLLDKTGSGRLQPVLSVGDRCELECQVAWTCYLVLDSSCEAVP